MRAAAVSRRAILAVAALTGGCTSINATDRTFDGTAWQVIAIDGQPTPLTDRYRLSFDKGKIGGRFGCNNFGGPYRLNGETLAAGQLAATLMGCPEPAATYETRGFAVLSQPMQLAWTSGSRLTLRNAKGSIELKRAP